LESAIRRSGGFAKTAGLQMLAIAYVYNHEGWLPFGGFGFSIGTTEQVAPP